jgi:glycosyltransferase involved in cell wall biosynthesis
MKIVINAASAKMGGAVSYLTNLLQHLPPPESGYRFFVFLSVETAKLLPDVRGNIELCPLPSENSSGWRRLWWEQITLRRFLHKEKVHLLFSTANFAMLFCPVRQVVLVRNALYLSKTYQQMFLEKHGLRFRLAFALRRWMILRSVRSADVVMTPTQAMLDDLARFVGLDRRKTLVNSYGAGMLPCPSPPWERGGTAASAFSSRAPAPSGARRAGPGLRPPKGYGRSGRTARYGPQAGEGVPPKPLAVSNSAGQDTCAPSAAAEPEVIRLLYVSLYSEHKNLSTLLNAMPLLNRNGAGKFLLKTTVNPAWEGAAWTVTHKEDLALARRADVAPWVEFLGPLQSEQLEDLYRQGDVFVFPSICESFGHPMVEAMVHGLLIVAADTQVNREMCGEAALYFSPLDPEDLAAKIVALIGNQALRQKLCTAARGRAAAHFRWRDHVERFLKAVENPPSHRSGSP